MAYRLTETKNYCLEIHKKCLLISKTSQISRRNLSYGFLKLCTNFLLSIIPKNLAGTVLLLLKS